MLTKKSKIWLVILIFFGITFLGGINVRFIIGNELLNFDEFYFRTSIPTDEENLIFKLLSYTSILVFFAYIFTFVSSIFFLKNLKVNYKENVWLLVCIILFYIFTPVELYSSFIDYKFFMLYLQNPPTHDELLRIFGQRIGLLKGVPWIALLSYYTIIAIAVFQPLKKSKKEIEDEQKLKQKEYSYKYYMHEDDDIIEDK